MKLKKYFLLPMLIAPLAGHASMGLIAPCKDLINQELARYNMGSFYPSPEEDHLREFSYDGYEISYTSRASGIVIKVIQLEGREFRLEKSMTGRKPLVVDLDAECKPKPPLAPIQSSPAAPLELQESQSQR